MTCHVPLRGGRFALPLALAAVLLAGCTGAADEPGAKERRGTRDEIDDLVVQAQAALPARPESVVEKQN